MAEARLTLALDTSRRGAGTALLASPDGSLVESLELTGGILGLAGAVRKLAETAGPRLAAVLAARGPGSYMGVRSGLASAVGVAQAKALPLALVGSLELAAARVDRRQGQLLVMVDAGRGGVYGQLFEPATEPVGLDWRVVSETVLLSPQDPTPAGWGQAIWVLRDPGVGDGRSPQATPAAALRSGPEALAWVARDGVCPARGYDQVSADYGVRVGEVA